MFDAGFSGDGSGNDFGGAGGSEAAEANDFVVLDEGGGFLGS